MRKALYAHLADLAAQGEACPTTTALAHAIGCAPGSIAEMLRRLVAARRIRVVVEKIPCSGNVNHYRVVTIVATGQSTAPRPVPVRNAPADELEMAKTFLRRRGPTVYAATVTHGRDAGDLVVVDRALLTPAQVIARARALGMGA
ncbi:helix-turn-helix domain-containing protein [Reyranella sp.]|uniref:helix-turn-helix domain-containing protein n=1 Tax=Reyranella sp. TaxID=1929291 RepID=UPI003D0A0657